ncbi:MAG: hypothetical protein HY908_12415 [Myxococcales bacterium]|nr:hypothetical protein [Myxococcales bacterium]
MKTKLALVFSFVAGALAMGCSNPCNDLKCANCADAATKSACELLVFADVKDACQSALDSGAYASCK